MGYQFSLKYSIEQKISGYNDFIKSNDFLNIYFINAMNLFRIKNFINILQFFNYDDHIPYIHQKFKELNS